jgi:phage tail protein X
MTGEYMEYVTIDGDRWDLIAWAMYGNAALMEPIIVANPQVPISRRLTGGLTLRIPILDIQPAVTGMPPWKR